VPVVSEFEGIEICLYFDDHLPPHFHAKYAGHEALVEIENSCVLKGTLAWTLDGKYDKLKDSWNQAKNMELPAKINPLK